MTQAAQRAQDLLRSVARESNLLVATRPVHATPSTDPVARELEALAQRIGALPPDPTSPRALGIDVTTGRATLGGQDLPSRDDADARLDFAALHMPVSRVMAQQLAASGMVRSLRLGVAMTLEPKTANLALLLREAGASVAVYAHPDETDVEVAEALRRRGIAVTADPTLSGKAEREAALAFLCEGPDGSGLDVVMDDGSHLVRLAHEATPDLVAGWIGVTEETTSGLTPLRLMEAQGVLATPVMAVNDAPTKTFFDNRYGTAQSCVFAIADLLDGAAVKLSDQSALVIGYGPVGQGVAAYLRALGAVVSVSERDAVRALQAVHDGFPVGEASSLAKGALVVSCTGAEATITADIRDVAKAVAVAGGVPGELELDDIEASLSPVAPHMERTPLGTLVLDRGGCINVTAAEGNPIEIMDLSFATQIASLQHLLATRPRVGVHVVPPAAVEEVAHAAVVAQKIDIQNTGAAQAKASLSWHSRRYRQGL